jgi:aryl-alcohol dehydrogenase-like predicted oxidoreductase
LTDKYTPDHQFAQDDERSWMAAFQGERFASGLNAVAELKAWAEGKGHSLVDLAIAWVLAHDAVTSAIVGAKTPEQVLQNARAADWVLSPEELEEIDQIQGDFRILNLHH